MNTGQRRLQLLRHAKSDWSATYGSDLTRPLSARGRRAARAMARWMRDNQVTQDVVYTSPSTRTRQTLELMAKEIRFKAIEIVDELYHADLDTFLEVLSQIPKEHSQVMLVGHNPGIEDLLLYLSDADPETTSGKLFPTAAFAEIRLPAQWDALSAGAGHLHILIRPGELDLE